ncbi:MULTISPECIES: DUF916 and DUF3324 domain-containing protein [unclassified Enterococcus]|uniref:DUF916 and DUF3324 domain-containing protein n=1 Tax=unclassified Enterococcus TaxID=2608891 RepID=UPI001CE03B6D|nr:MULTISPECIES: DUF916 and DUF3324 domain-containing protein [unclassified Enterococcus]MCA5013469.1 DUF916 and DUF3324 domain-containing protein [Enterococcus sp. S23]MCA5016719.1 DUF916 and DUF3324 domain-containing protein [Enterococcus sp. S22(2020)]
MKSIKNKSLICIQIITSILFVGIISLSLGITASADNMRFAVKPNLPENQVDKSKTYFDLKMIPGQKETIELEVSNSTDEEIIVEINANTALTNDNGVADYSQSMIKKYDGTLKTPFSTIAKPHENELTLAPNESKIAKIDIDMPKDEYDGLILGGIHLAEKDTKTEKSADSGVQIKNNFAYVVGVSLRENDNEVKTHLELNDIVPTQVNYRNFVKANIQNTTAEIVKNFKVDARIYTEKGKEVLHQTKKEDMRMVPNSNFDYAISWDNQEFKAGVYRLEMDALANGEEYHWVKNFTIDAKEAKELNAKAVDLEKSSNLMLYIMIGIAILIALLLVLIVLVLRKKGDKKEQ